MAMVILPIALIEDRLLIIYVLCLDIPAPTALPAPEELPFVLRSDSPPVMSVVFEESLINNTHLFIVLYSKSISHPIQKGSLEDLLILGGVNLSVPIIFFEGLN